MATHEIMVGDCKKSLASLAKKSVNCCITSPPYFGLRDYGIEGQHGLEKTPQEFVDNLVNVMGFVWDALCDDGTLWLNLGDSYTSGGRKTRDRDKKLASRHMDFRAPTPDGLKEKDLIGIPWRVALALQDDGWHLRQDIIWSKPNPMPESVKDRCTKAHEYIFLLTKSPRYYFDHKAIEEPATYAGQSRGGSTNRYEQNSAGMDNKVYDTRNKRSVWTVNAKPFKGAHFATFPPELIVPCVLAGCPEGGVVLDPYGGAGTTSVVAETHGRNSIICELNPAYAEIARERIESHKAAIANPKKSRVKPERYPSGQIKLFPD